MRLRFDGERVMAVVAHPDDAEYYCGGTLARAASDGAALAVVILCRGDKGIGPGEPGTGVAELRRNEARTACDRLGAELLMLDRGDGELVNDRALQIELLDRVRHFQPTIVLAHAPHDYHADHRAASAAVEAVSWYSASHGQRSAHPALEQQPALWWMDTMNMIGFEPSFWIDISDYLEFKQQLLACHASQTARAADSDFSPLIEQMTLQNRMRGAQSGVAAAEAFQLHHAWKRTRAW